MDATYKVTKYTLLLFFVCVKTNVSYVVVGQFVTQYEDAKSISEALLNLKSWINDWYPKKAMCNFREAEINTIEDIYYSRKFP